MKQLEAGKAKENRRSKWEPLSKKVKLVLIGLVAGLVLGVCATVVAFTHNPPDKEPAAPEVNVVALFEEINQISELATASERYTVVEKVEKKNDKLFDLIDVPFTDNFFILSYMGTIKAGVNLESADISTQGTVVKVALPPAEILSDTIDTGSFNVLHEQTGVFSPVHVEDVTQYLDKAQQKVEANAAGGRVLEEARENAETSIRTLLEASLPEDYTVEFTDASSEPTTQGE